MTRFRSGQGSLRALCFCLLPALLAAKWSLKSELLDFLERSALTQFRKKTFRMLCPEFTSAASWACGVVPYPKVTWTDASSPSSGWAFSSV